MSSLLWIDEEADEAIDLGDPLTLLSAVAEWLKAVGDDTAGYEALFDLPDYLEQEPDAAWLADARAQAAAFLKEHSGKLSDDAKWALRQLTGEAEG